MNIPFNLNTLCLFRLSRPFAGTCSCCVSASSGRLIKNASGVHFSLPRPLRRGIAALMSVASSAAWVVLAWNEPTRIEPRWPGNGWSLKSFQTCHQIKAQVHEQYILGGEKLETQRAMETTAWERKHMFTSSFPTWRRLLGPIRRMLRDVRHIHKQKTTLQFQYISIMFHMFLFVSIFVYIYIYMFCIFPYI